jgi:hypothetical protein
MPRRMGRPGLLGTMARTAVIAGTATAVSGNVQQKQHAGAQQAAQQQAAQQQAADQAAQAQADLAAMQAQVNALQAQPAPAPAAPAASPQDELMAQLTRLGQLNAAGLITDAEFTAAKAKLLGI